jgi:hypothetical protein
MSTEIGVEGEQAGRRWTAGSAALAWMAVLAGEAHVRYGAERPADESLDDHVCEALSPLSVMRSGGGMVAVGAVLTTPPVGDVRARSRAVPSPPIPYPGSL